jgi:hypothetical protein
MKTNARGRRKTSMNTRIKRYRKIYDLVIEVIEPSIGVIKRVRKRRSMPYKEIEKILNVFFPRTKHYKTAKGFYKHVFENR